MLEVVQKRGARKEVPPEVWQGAAQARHGGVG